ncbi:MAG: 50S ribosomal protein L25 [bacterium]|nr:50S ribosomal protein L25 [bacterium]
MELNVQKRSVLGRSVKALRKQGLVPAELYGKGVENFHLSVPAKEFKKVYKLAGENTVVNVMLDGKKYPVLINDVSFDPLSGNVKSADLYQIRMDEKLKVGVPLEFVGIAPAVKGENGILVKALQEVMVEALPMDIPRDFKVDLSKLAAIGQSFYVKDLSIPSGVKVLVAPETVVATVTAQVTEEEELAMREAAGVGTDTIKVETEEKKAERDAVKAATSETAAVPAKEASKTKEAPKK